MLQASKKPLCLESRLNDLTLYHAEIAPDDPGETVIKLFDDNPLLPGIIIKKSEQFLGMVSRRCFFEYMSRPYSLELFCKRPLHILYEFMSKEALVLPGDASILQAARQALQRVPELLYEPIVVRLNSGEYNVLDMHELLLAQSQIHELTLKALRESQQALFEEKELAQVTLQSIGDAVITTDAEGCLKSLNPVAEKLTGWQASEAQGKPLTEIFRIINEDTREPVHNPVETVLREGRIVALASSTVLIARNGNEVGIDDSAAPIRAKNGEMVGAVLVFHDVTSERILTRQLSWQASHDTLTKLLNRRGFEQSLEQNLSSARLHNHQHALCYLDLDRFKIVNDTCGHLAGDELLRQITILLQSQIRKTDVLARLGGDEFGLLLYQCSLSNAQRIANGLRESVEKFRFTWHNKTFSIGVSIGLTAITADTQNSTRVLQNADAACYAAKNKGRNRVHVFQADDSELQQQQSEMLWLGLLTKALEENRFCLYYQKIALINGLDNKTWEHYEILLRMIDETGNLVPPMAFIPAAERYNLMPAIDRWVIRNLFAHESDRFQKKWQSCQQIGEHCDCSYTINLSGSSINDDQFIDFVHEQLTLHKIPPKLICFEITETVAITNFNKAAKFIQSLKKIGCRFALDDFGSGMSSFAYLKNLSVDYLKIDGLFIKNIVDDVVACAMVEAINRVGQVMGIKTIAELVENEAILAKLRELGVDYAQGYAIGEPRPFLYGKGSPGSMVKTVYLVE